MFIVKLVKDYRGYGMGTEETNVVICKTIKTAIDQAQKVISQELVFLSENDPEYEDSYISTYEEIVKWSNAIGGAFKFYASKYEDRMVEIEEVEFVE